MRVEFSDKAEADLEAIADYIARDNPPRALSFTRDLRRRCLGLATFPRRYPLLAGYEEVGIRKAVHAAYLIFFQYDEEAVSIVHIVHGAAEYGHLFEA